MTYRNLLKKLQETNGMRLDDDVTVYDRTNDEYYPGITVKETDEQEQDVLDDGHVFIVIET
jgi:hypothetical protein